MRKSGKEMNVIRHNDVATNGDIMLPGLSRKNAKCVVNFITCQESLTFVCVECDEVERANIVKQMGEPGRTPRPLLRGRTWHSSSLSIVMSEVNCVRTALSRRAIKWANARERLDIARRLQRSVGCCSRVSLTAANL
jgi:hypothetical protein